MSRIWDIAMKDITQLVRERELFLFLLIMPLVFTMLFGYVFGGFSKSADSRLPVGLVDEDNSSNSRRLQQLLSNSEVIRLIEYPLHAEPELENAVAGGDLAAAIFIPKGYGHSLLKNQFVKVQLVGDTTGTAGTSVKSEVLSAANRLAGAVQTALVLEEAAGSQISFDYALSQSLSAWENPPIQIHETTSTIISAKGNVNGALAHTSPGMMLQFAFAGLITASQIIVSERKSHVLSRLLTTAVQRVHILLGHYISITLLIAAQFGLLILFGQFILKVNYFREPLAVILLSGCAVLCISAFGLLIGVIAKSDEHAVMMSLICMFVFAGLGGSWVPLDATTPAFQLVGHATPIAWAMDGFNNILIRGSGIQSILFPGAMLLVYALFVFTIAAWRFQFAQER